jgi:hypothetical protein
LELTAKLHVLKNEADKLMQLNIIDDYIVIHYALCSPSRACDDDNASLSSHSSLSADSSLSPRDGSLER